MGEYMDKDEILKSLEQHLKDIESTYKQPHADVDTKWLSQICTLVGIPKDGIDIAARILSLKPPTPLVWLHMAECTGCSGSFLRLDKPGVDALILDYISLEYHETIMGAVGFNAKKMLEDALKKDFILVIEGGVSLAENAHFLTSGANSITGEEEVREIAQKAKAIFAVGTCSSFGGVQAAMPNPTHSVGIDTFINTVVNIPGCPPSEANIIGSIMYFILLRELPKLDRLNRPIWSYGKNLHDLCERKAKFESGDFVQSFDDINMQESYCLYKVGCKGPYVSNNCPKVKFNAKTSWPVSAGHGCIGCSEPNFWDDFGRIESPLNNANSYNKNSRQLSTLPFIHSNTDTIPSNTLILTLHSDKPTQIYIQPSNPLDSQNESNLIICSFNKHFPTLLAHISNRNKLGARLIENYTKWRINQGLNIQNDADAEILSNNLFDILPLIAQMFGENLHTLEMLECAKSYLFPHVSKLDIKLSGTDICQIEVDKSLRLPLCYLLGGLEIQGVAYGAISSVCEALCTAITTLAKTHNVEKIAFVGDVANHILIQDRFKNHLPKWLKVI